MKGSPSPPPPPIGPSRHLSTTAPGQFPGSPTSRFTARAPPSTKLQFLGFLPSHSLSSLPSLATSPATITTRARAA